MIRLLRALWKKQKKKSHDKCQVAQKVSVFTKTRTIDSKTKATRQGKGKWRHIGTTLHFHMFWCFISNLWLSNKNKV
jgi:hypothetical protein